LLIFKNLTYVLKKLGVNCLQVSKWTCTINWFIQLPQIDCNSINKLINELVPINEIVPFVHHLSKFFDYNECKNDLLFRK